ncbi:MAG: TetR/AcrR family transcriptional regulator [Phycisphaerales bacterium]
MQRPNEENRRQIIAVATRLFATRRYHEVRLEDVAKAAKIGKGTIYVYFKSKDDLFLTLVREGFARLVTSIETEMQAPDRSSWERLTLIVDGFVAFATRFPHLFELLRSGVLPADDPALQSSRRALSRLIERNIRQGVRAGEFRDPRPKLTAQYVVAFVRGAMLYGPPVGRSTLRAHLLRIVGHGILVRPRRGAAGGAA